MYFIKLSFYLFCLGILSARIVLAVDIGTDTTINANSTERHTITDANVTLINNAEIDVTGGNTAIGSTLTGTTIINNAGATIRLSGANDKAINIEDSTNNTVINSGTIISGDGQAIAIKDADGVTIINNEGAVLEARRNVIRCDGANCEDPIITNSGTMFTTSNAGVARVVHMPNARRAIFTNTATGQIFNDEDDMVFDKLGRDSLLINSGLIRSLNGEGGITLTKKNAAIFIGKDEDNSTVLLKDDSILVGTICNINPAGDEFADNAKLHIDHGYGRAYMYHTLGPFELADLSGNRIVKGSATAVGMGAQETVDEVLGQRAYNLRTTLKRYASVSDPKPRMEPFAYVSHRDRDRTTLRYDNHAAGTNFIYPVVPEKVNLILTVERNKLDLDEDHDITKNSFLIGVNTNDFMQIDDWKASGFIAGGVTWHNSSRAVLTNIVVSGIADVGAEYETTEAITGISFSHTYDQKVNESVTNKWETDLGLTLSYSHTPSYMESLFFTWEERNLTQLSIHIGEQLTSMLGDKVQFRLGGEFEHRSVIAGKNQNHALNAVTVDFRSGAFYENSISMNTGFDYALGDYSKVYLQFDGRVSDQTAYSLGVSAGLELVF
jgi:hypothetical protein